MRRRFTRSDDRPYSQVSYSERQPPERRAGRREQDYPERSPFDPEELGFEDDEWEQFNRNLDYAHRVRMQEDRWARDYGSGQYRGVGPEGYTRSDESIYEDVCERLTLHGYLDARGIRPQVSQGIVTLSGEVDSRQAKRLAEDLASDVSGVHDVENQLKIRRKER